MIFVGLGVKNQFILVKTIDFSLLVTQKLSVESSINDNAYQKIRIGYVLKSADVGTLFSRRNSENSSNTTAHTRLHPPTPAHTHPHTRSHHTTPQ